MDALLKFSRKNNGEHLGVLKVFTASPRRPARPQRCSACMPNVFEWYWWGYNIYTSIKSKNEWTQHCFHLCWREIAQEEIYGEGKSERTVWKEKRCIKEHESLQLSKREWNPEMKIMAWFHDHSLNNIDHSAVRTPENQVWKHFVFVLN